jgi:hypothetical protein
MKTSKKIIPALAMLLVSAVMLATSSFAWFAMSTSVSANGMSVDIQSDSVYLLIAGDTGLKAYDTAHDDFTLGTSTVTPAIVQEINKLGDTGYTINDDFKLLPTAQENTITAANVATPAQWYTMTAKDAGTSTGKDGSKINLTDLSGYVVKYTFYVTMAKGSTQASNLCLGSATFTASTDSAATGSDQTIAPIRATVVCNNKMVQVTNTTTPEQLKTAANVFATTVTDESLLTFDVYIWYDGNNGSVYTNNVPNLEDVDFTFTLCVNEAVTP